MLSATRLELDYALPLGGWLLALLAVAVLAVIGWSYLRLPASSTRPRALLLALRSVAVVLLLWCLAQPFIRQYHAETRQNQAVVVLDVSESMQIPDQPAEEGKGGPRFVPARDAAVRLADALGEDFGTHLYLAGNKTERVEADALEDAAPEAERTDIATALSTPFDDLRDERIAAVFLLTDGGHNTGDDVDAAVAEYTGADIPVPVFPIAFGRPDVADLAVADLRVRRTVTRSTLLNVTAVLRSQGLAAAGIPVRVLRQNDDGSEEVVQQQEVALSPQRSEVEVDFEFLPSGSGYRQYRIEAAVQPQEVVTDNNSRPFAVNVTNRPLRVLYMEGTENRLEGRRLWEHQYLEEALKEDHIEITTLLRDDAAKAAEAGIYTVQHPTKGFPRTKRGLYQYDVVIISDIPRTHFSPKQLQNMVDFVGRFGGGLVMIGGWTAFGPGGWDESVIDKLLPVDMLGKDEGIKEGLDFEWEVTEEGYAHPIMRLVKDAAENRRIWQEELPPFHGFNMVQRPKPAATVLAVYPFEGNLYSDNYVLLAVQQYGRGRSMAFTPDTTYGWGSDFETRFGELDQDTWVNDARYYKRFWQNAIRWLAHYRLQAPNTLAYIELDQSLYARGDTAQVRVTALTQEYEPTHDAELHLTLHEPDGTTREVPLTPDFSKDGRFTAELPLPELGRHELALQAFLDGEPLAEDRVMFFVREDKVEFRDFALNQKLLQDIAYETGGQVYPAGEADQAVAELRETTHLVQRSSKRDLWDRWLVLGAILAALGGEWFLRKKAGLA